MLQVILPNLVLFLVMIGLIVAITVVLVTRVTRPGYDHRRRWSDPPPPPPPAP